IETGGAAIEEYPKHQPYPEEPDSTHNQEQAKSPAAMNDELAGKRVAQGKGGAEHDEDGVEADGYVLRDVANGPADPNHIKTDDADRESGRYVDTPVPAMNGWCAVPDPGDELNRSAGDNHDGQEKMHGDGQIAHGVAGDIPVRHDGVPRREIPLHGRAAIENR